MEPPFDVVMTVAKRDRHLAGPSLRHLAAYTTARTFFVITGKRNFAHFRRLEAEAPGLRLQLVDETTLMPGVDRLAIAAWIESQGVRPRLAGWYFQQFLKMAAPGLPGMAEHYLIWDADTILLRPLEFFDTEGRALVDPHEEHHPAYFETLKRILGLERVAEHSFIAEHFMVKTAYMQELVAAIEQFVPGDEHWAWKILNNIAPEDLDDFGFSEFETYGNFLAARHPDSFARRSLPTTRRGAQQFGHRPSRRDLQRLARDYCYASFESWDFGSPWRIAFEKTLSLLSPADRRSVLPTRETS